MRPLDMTFRPFERPLNQEAVNRPACERHMERDRALAAGEADASLGDSAMMLHVFNMSAVQVAELGEEDFRACSDLGETKCSER